MKRRSSSAENPSEKSEAFEMAKEMAKETVKDSGKDSAKEMAKNSGKDLAKDPGKELAIESEKESAAEMTKEDICAHLGDDYQKFLGAIVPPIFQNTLFIRPDLEYIYTRNNNPTIEIAEKKIAALEGGEAARVFGSGMGAISASVFNSISAGSHIIAMKYSYNGARHLFGEYLPKFGIETTFVSGTNPDDFRKAIRPNTSLIYLESPSFIYLEMIDIEAIVKIAKEKGIRTIIDNTWATPMYQSPLKMGVDIVVQSGTKYLGGHSDILAGVAVSRSEIIKSIDHDEKNIFGAIMDPHQAWLLIRGLRTLPIRMKQHQENGMKVAEYLEKRAKVNRVLYPGLKSHPQYEIGRKQMTGYSAMMLFVIDTDFEGGERFLKKLKYIQYGVSWGGFESLAFNFAQPKDFSVFGGEKVEGNMIRLSVGLENVDTLIADLDQALNAI